MGSAALNGAAMSYEKGLIVDLKGLRKLGVTVSKATLERWMSPVIVRTTGRRGSQTVQFLPNPRPFPRSRKLGNTRNYAQFWVLADVLEWLETAGLDVNQDDQGS